MVLLKKEVKYFNKLDTNKKADFFNKWRHYKSTKITEL